MTPMDQGPGEEVVLLMVHSCCSCGTEVTVF